MPLVCKAFGDIITFTRASSATYFDSAGVLQTATTDTPRFDYDPATLAQKGFLIEQAATNSIRNNTMQGAVAGTPGTAPTNWTISNPVDGITPQIVGTGTSNGITYIDVKYTGTSGTAGATTLIGFEQNAQIAALNAQIWTSSAYVAIVGGSTTNISALVLRTRFNNAAAANLTTTDVSVATATATLSRFVVTGTATDATTAFVNATIVANFADNSAIDITLRIGLPQLERGAVATSVIPTTTAAVTRSADVATINTLSPWFNSSEGTLFATYSFVGLRGAAGQGIIQIDDGTSNNRTALLVTSINTMQNVVISGGTTVGNSTSPSTTYVANTTYKNAFAYKLDDAQTAINGVAGTVDTSVSPLPTGFTTLRLGTSTTSAALVWLTRFTYYPRRLTDLELQAITA